MKARNRVIAGDFAGCVVSSFWGSPCIAVGLMNKIHLDATTVKRFAVLDVSSLQEALSVFHNGAAKVRFMKPSEIHTSQISSMGSREVFWLELNLMKDDRCLLEIDQKVYRNCCLGFAATLTAEKGRSLWDRLKHCFNGARSVRYFTLKDKSNLKILFVSAGCAVLGIAAVMTVPTLVQYFFPAPVGHHTVSPSQLVTVPLTSVSFDLASRGKIQKWDVYEAVQPLVRKKLPPHTAVRFPSFDDVGFIFSNDGLQWEVISHVNGFKKGRIPFRTDYEAKLSCAGGSWKLVDLQITGQYLISSVPDVDITHLVPLPRWGTPLEVLKTRFRPDKKEDERASFYNFGRMSGFFAGGGQRILKFGTKSVANDELILFTLDGKFCGVMARASKAYYQTVVDFFRSDSRVARTIEADTPNPNETSMTWLNKGTLCGVTIEKTADTFLYTIVKSDAIPKFNENIRYYSFRFEPARLAKQSQAAVQTPQHEKHTDSTVKKPSVPTTKPGLNSKTSGRQSPRISRRSFDKILSQKKAY